MVEAAPTKRSPMARWGVVARDITRQIEQKEVSPGERLPSEIELGEHYGVSRITIRQALSSLEEKGLVVRKHGAGTFVSETIRAVQHNLSIAEPWQSHLLDATSVASSAQVDADKYKPAPKGLLLDLGITSADVTDRYFKRVQLVNGKPIGLSETWLAEGVAQGIENEPLLNGSISQTLKERFDLASSTVDSYVYAASAIGDVAELLECPPESPLVAVDELSRLHNGNILSASRTFWLGQRVRFHNRHEVG